MLGRDLALRLRYKNEDVAAYDRNELDITDTTALRATLDQVRPAVVVNCAAWTAVDDAEIHEEAASLVNGAAVAGLAAACADYGNKLIQVSTDYVFNGLDRQLPYHEYDAPSPGTAYGRGKLIGEQVVLDRLGETAYIVRTAWLYGAYGANFVRTMIARERQRPTVEVVDDQRGQPSWTADVAAQIIALVHSDARGGIYHATSSGETTWYGLAREVFSLLGADPARVRATTSSVYPRPAPRPSYSVLGHDGWARVGLEPIGDWRQALRRAFPEQLSAFATDQTDSTS